MFVVQLIGRLADTVIELPYSAATSNISMGTCRLATDDEVANAGYVVEQAPPVALAEDAMPEGYRFEPTGHGGYDLFDRGGVRLNEEQFPNAAAARSYALDHAKAGTVLISPAEQLSLEVQSGQIAQRPTRAFSLADYRAEANPEHPGKWDLFDVGGVKLNDEPLNDPDEAKALAQEHLDIALDQGEGPDNDPAAGNEDDKEVEVPADWQSLHHMKRRALARLIIGEEPASTAAADAAIADYLKAQNQTHA